MKKLILGAGCFWGVEDAFYSLNGVLTTEVGYAGGATTNPTYNQVCKGDTGHAEVVKLSFDPNQVSFSAILDLFFKLHDPTQINRQGWDIGSQYRSVIFTYDEEQQREAKQYKMELEKQKKFFKPIVTQIEKFSSYYKAEEYHQKYLLKKKGG